LSKKPPLKSTDTDRLAAVLARAEALAKQRDRAADDAALAEMGIDPTDWSVEAVRALRDGPTLSGRLRATRRRVLASRARARP